MIRAITLDLDDTLWPVWPAIERAEVRLHEWLREHAPSTAAAHDRVSLRRVRDGVAHERPDWAHDLSAIRLESIRRALHACGDDPALADAAFEVFFDERQRVDLYVDAAPALQRLAARFPLFALSNGNADLVRTGVAPHFVGGLSAREFGIGKPHAPIFHEACRQLGVPPHEVLHVGDDAQLDVEGALDAGLRAAWLRRSADARAPRGDPHHVVADLIELAQRLGA